MKRINIILLQLLILNIGFGQSPEEFRKNKGDFNRLFCSIADESKAPGNPKVEGHFRFYNTSPYGRITFYYNQTLIDLQPKEYSKPFPGKIPSSLQDVNIKIDNFPLSNYYRIVDYEDTYQEFSNTITKKFIDKKTLSELTSDVVLSKKTLNELTTNKSMVPAWFTDKYYYDHKLKQTNTWLKKSEDLIVKISNNSTSGSNQNQTDKSKATTTEQQKNNTQNH